MRCLSVALVVFAGPLLAQQARFAPGELTREKALLLAVPGSSIPDGALGPFADLDGDGAVDLLGDAGTYVNNGFGRFLLVQRLELAAEPRLAFLRADPGTALDLLARTHLYLGDGAGGFADASAGLPAGFVADAAVVGDLDGDLDADVAAVRRMVWPAPALVELALNDGSGTFTDASAALPPTPLAAFALAVGDVDGDADLDLVVACGLDELWLNDGAAHFTKAIGALPAVNDDTRSLALVDVDGDLDLDLVLGNDDLNGGPGSRLLLNDGAGSFTAGALPPPGSARSTVGVLVLDREGDGDADLVLLDAAQLDAPAFYDSPVRLLVNDGGGGFSESGDLPDGAGASRAGFAGDVDGDGDPDLIVEDALHGNRMLLNDGLGAFAPASTARFPFDDVHDHAGRVVALGDLDGDGLSDVFTAQMILRAGPPGVLVPTGVALPPLPTHCLDILGLEQARDVALGDVDGDGDLDAYLAGPGLTECGGSPLQSNRLWLNDGSAAFADQTAARLPQAGTEVTGVPQRVALLELDGDGDLDAACVRSRDSDGGGESSCYVNDGSGVFTRKEGLGSRGTTGAFGDLDGDGAEDYLAGASNFSGNSVALNDGSAHFALAPSALPAHELPLFAYECVLGDVDADGDLDAYVACAYPSRAFFYVNDGSAHFADEPERLPVSIAESGTQNSAVFTDLDLDGDLDLVSPRRMFLNDGHGSFADGAARTHVWATGVRQAVGDLDLDGDPDVLSVDSVELTVATGLARGLEGFGPARIGKRLTLLLHGAPHTPWTLLESTRTTRAFLGALGWLLVDPSRLVTLASGTLDARGEAPFRRMLPADAALIGRTTYWQAFTGRPAHGTNLLVTRITGL